MKCADLSYACLDNANLKGSDFTGVSLRHASVRGKIIGDAEYTDGLYLEGANMEGFEYSSALLGNIFASARLYHTIVSDARTGRIKIISEYT
ncbi:pentapeptide repeat-containing protein [Baaleninema simplex]|uniref:pentapeptide repeat-containing protein n=1 Tax=Baaleninema simplex TaxID=2862350 RepID=UPI001FE0ACA3|nr:pentapeptide repeat-containing protein [Baaleninema simplex]